MSTYILDLDHTLLDTTRWKQDLANSLGLTVAEWEQSIPVGSNPLDIVPANKRAAFAAIMNKLPSYLYADSIDFLQQLIKGQYNVVILTFGNIPWQELKLQKLHLPAEVQAIATDQPKVELLSQFIKERTIFIDDRASEIDAAKQAFPHIEAYWMQRPNGKHVANSSQLADKIITNLQINI